MSHRRSVCILLALATALLAVPVSVATHNNQGTVKVHDESDEDPDVRNVPHVDCEFWIEGFNIGDDSGWLVFYAWPPTGDMGVIAPTGDDLTWAADTGSAEEGWHFENGPYSLPAGHYRVEAFTDDGHPGRDGGHFAKAKEFWVEPCDGGGGELGVPCPANLTATATSEGGIAQIALDWDAVTDADAYVVYRAVDGGSWGTVTTTDAATTAYTDTDVTAGSTYEYKVTAVIDSVESDDCDAVSAVAVPFFGAPVLAALAMVGVVAAYAVWRRK